MQQRSFWQHLQRPVFLSENTIQIFLVAFFFCSGVTALIYQLMWQRLLYQIFGMDLLSLTIIISVFMFGLGIGGLVGGYLVDKIPQRLLMLYVLLEVMIGIFGFTSPQCIGILSFYLLPMNHWIVASGSFLLLAFPTILMGATFPILVAHVYERTANMGASVGLLYFMNTLGGAIGAYFAGFVLLSSLTITEILYRTAWLNLSIALSAYLVFRKNSCCKPVP